MFPHSCLDCPFAIRNGNIAEQLLDLKEISSLNKIIQVIILLRMVRFLTFLLLEWGLLSATESHKTFFNFDIFNITPDGGTLSLDSAMTFCPHSTFPWSIISLHTRPLKTTKCITFLRVFIPHVF